MGRKDKAPPLTKRKIKTERRCRRWQTFQRRRRLLGFDDVPQAERPRLATQRTPIALSLRSIEGWSAPRALKERLAADELPRAAEQRRHGREEGVSAHHGP